MDELVKAYLNFNLKPDAKKTLENYLKADNIGKAKIIIEDDLIGRMVKVNEDKDWLIEVCDKICSTKFPRETLEKYAEFRLERMVLMEDLMEGGYDSVADTKLNSRINEGWLLLNQQYETNKT